VSVHVHIHVRVHVQVHSLFQYERDRFTSVLQELCTVCVIYVSLIRTTDRILTYSSNRYNYNNLIVVDQDKAIAHCYKILSTSGVTGRLRVAREVRGRGVT
jgi:hypothetical protein